MVDPWLHRKIFTLSQPLHNVFVNLSCFLSFHPLRIKPCSLKHIWNVTAWFPLASRLVTSLESIANIPFLFFFLSFSSRKSDSQRDAFARRQVRGVKSRKRKTKRLVTPNSQDCSNVTHPRPRSRRAIVRKCPDKREASTSCVTRRKKTNR